MIAIRNNRLSTADFGFQLRPSLLVPARLLANLQDGPTRNVFDALPGLEHLACSC